MRVHAQSCGSVFWCVCLGENVHLLQRVPEGVRAQTDWKNGMSLYLACAVHDAHHILVLRPCSRIVFMNTKAVPLMFFAANTFSMLSRSVPVALIGNDAAHACTIAFV